MTISPGLAPTMHKAAARAEALGLYLADFNSGAARNPLNGFRIFPGTGPHDFFAGGHLAHLRTKEAVVAWLHGYATRDASPLDGQDTATILAALRYYQMNGQGDPANRSDAIHEIATNGGAEVSHDAAGIDDLCERLNCRAKHTSPDESDSE